MFIKALTNSASAVSAWVWLPFSALGRYWEKRKVARQAWIRERRAVLAAHAKASTRLISKVFLHLLRSALAIPEYFFGLSRISQALVVTILVGWGLGAALSESLVEQRFGLGTGELVAKNVACLKTLANVPWASLLCSDLSEKQTRQANRARFEIHQERRNKEFEEQDRKAAEQAAANASRNDVQDRLLQELLASNKTLEELAAEGLRRQDALYVATTTLNDYLSGARALTRTELEGLTRQITENREKIAEVRQKYSSELENNRRLRASVEAENLADSKEALVDTGSEDGTAATSGHTLAGATRGYTPPPMNSFVAPAQTTLNTPNGTQLDLSEANPEEIQSILDRAFSAAEDESAANPPSTELPSVALPDGSSNTHTVSDSLPQNVSLLVETQEERLASSREAMNASIEAAAKRSEDQIEGARTSLRSAQEHSEREIEDSRIAIIDSTTDLFVPRDDLAVELSGTSSLTSTSPLPSSDIPSTDAVTDQLGRVSGAARSRGQVALDKTRNFAARPANPAQPAPVSPSSPVAPSSPSWDYNGYSEDNTFIDGAFENDLRIPSVTSQPMLDDFGFYSPSPGTPSPNDSSSVLPPEYDISEQNWGVPQDGFDLGSFDLTSPSNGLTLPSLDQSGTEFLRDNASQWPKPN